MEKTDRFIQIATGGHKKLTGDVKRLDEISPLSIEHFALSSSDKRVSPRIEKGEDELYQEYIAEKNSLKEHFKPFLEKRSRRIDLHRIELNDFLYRKETESDKKDFSNVLAGGGDWQRVRTPHYVGETGKWNCFYKTTLNIKPNGKHHILHFQSVDYQCDVYLNGRMIKTHTGFFAPFEVDITPYAKEGENDLLLVVQNDLTTSGISAEGEVSYGNKIYAATNIGYDEPKEGWHHCPAGAGIIGRIYLYESNDARITDCFVKTNCDTGEIKVITKVENYGRKHLKLDAFYSIEGRNFVASIYENRKGTANSFQLGDNSLEETFVLKEFRRWSLNEPYLYDVTIVLKDEGGNIVDEYQTHFGMRKFVMDLESKPHKGAFYFNDERIFLRGANEMGHLPRAVMEGNFDQLIDDILAAKVAGLNFYRITQRPTLSEVYDYFDMLGMLCQSDFPIFSYLTKGALPEAHKQVNEMELLTRNHPSVVIESFCNETLDKTAWGKEQYVLSRFDIEKFFDIAKSIVHLQNPDRVIKYSEGDYAPLEDTYGISDFHCYTYWYISHGLPSGKLRKGYLPPMRKDYMCGVGEYGVDGLDSYELMLKYAPKEWLPKTIDDPWSPKVIAKSQCYSQHGNFFPEQDGILNWIKASREFQKEAIKAYVHSLRLRSDYIESTALHLLIDAWPMGWTKTLIDVDRMPKPAFYAFKEANIPLRVSLRRDQFSIYQKDEATVEVYAFNDLSSDKNVSFNASVFYGDRAISFEGSGIAKASGTTYLGDILVKGDDFVGDALVVVEMRSGEDVTYDEVKLSIKPNLVKAKRKPLILSKSLECVNEVCEGEIDPSFIFVDRDYYVDHQIELEEKIKNGSTVYLNMTAPMNILGRDIIFQTHTLEEEVGANNLLFTSRNNEYTKDFQELDFQNFYNSEKGYQDLSAWFKFYYEGMDEIVYTFEDTGEEEYRFHKRKKLVMGEIAYGKGKIIVSTLSALKGCVGQNPVLDQLFVNILTK